MKRYPITTVYGRLQFVQLSGSGTMEPQGVHWYPRVRGYKLNLGSMRWFHMGKSRGTHGTRFADACTSTKSTSLRDDSSIAHLLTWLLKKTTGAEAPEVCWLTLFM